MACFPNAGGSCGHSGHRDASLVSGFPENLQLVDLYAENEATEKSLEMAGQQCQKFFDPWKGPNPGQGEFGRVRPEFLSSELRGFRNTLGTSIPPSWGIDQQGRNILAPGDGRLYVSTEKNPIPKLLIDLNARSFEEVETPDWAKKWQGKRKPADHPHLLMTNRS